MHEIEAKAWIENPEKTERLLRRLTGSPVHCMKNDEYWTIGGKTIRIREETIDGKTTVLITQKVKTIAETLENNQELECELPVTSAPVFRAILKNTGFIRTAQKEKNTKIFTPFRDFFEPALLADDPHITVELSFIPPLGSFLEIEVLYQDSVQDIFEERQRILNAQQIVNMVLRVLNIPMEAIEARPYNELLREHKMEQEVK